MNRWVNYHQNRHQHLIALFLISIITVLICRSVRRHYDHYHHCYKHDLATKGNKEEKEEKKKREREREREREKKKNENNGIYCWDLFQRKLFFSILVVIVSTPVRWKLEKSKVSVQKRERGSSAGNCSQIVMSPLLHCVCVCVCVCVFECVCVCVCVCELWFLTV